MTGQKRIIEALMNLNDERVDFLNMFDKDTMDIKIAIYDKDENVIDSIWLSKDGTCNDFKE